MARPNRGRSRTEIKSTLFSLQNLSYFYKKSLLLPKICLFLLLFCVIPCRFAHLNTNQNYDSQTKINRLQQTFVEARIPKSNILDKFTNNDHFTNELNVPAASQQSKTIVNFSSLPVEKRATIQDKTFATKENNKNQTDTINDDQYRRGRAHNVPEKDQPIIAPMNYRLSKLGSEFDGPNVASSAQHPVSSRANPDSQSSLLPSLHRQQNTGSTAIEPIQSKQNKPSGMDDLLGGLLQLMGGNLKMQSNGQPQLPPGMSADINKKLMSNLLTNLNRQTSNNRFALQHTNNNNRQNFPAKPPQQPPQLPSQQSSQQPPQSQQFSHHYSNPLSFIPLMTGQQRPPNIPLTSSATQNQNVPKNFLQNLPPKLPSNLPSINGLSKSEMDALYSQFVNAHQQQNNGKNQAVLMQNLLKLTGGKSLPPGLFPGSGSHSTHKPSKVTPGKIALSSVTPLQSPGRQNNVPGTSSVLEPHSEMNFNVLMSGGGSPFAWTTPSLSISSSSLSHKPTSISATSSASNGIGASTTVSTTGASSLLLSPTTTAAAVPMQNVVASTYITPPARGQWSSFGQSDTSIIRPSVVTSIYTPPSSSSLPSMPDIITLDEQQEPSVFEMVVKHTIGPNGNEQRTIFPTPIHTQPTVGEEAATAVRQQQQHFKPSQQQAGNGDIRPTKSLSSSHNTAISPSTQTPPLVNTRPYVKFNTKPEITVQKPQIDSQSSSTSTRYVKTTDVVYGKRVTTKPSLASSSIETSFIPTSTYSPRPHPTPTSTPQLLSSTIAHGQPQVTPVEVNEVVKPKVGVSTNQSKPKQSKSQGRRPPFRPRPNVPIVRIDTCIVGDDTTCDVNLNEKCLTEFGLSSCQCRPGFARFVPRTLCIPILAISFSMRLDKMNNNKVQFTRGLLNPNSEEYQYLEYETVSAINSLFSMTKSLSEEFMSVKVNRFYSISGKTIVNATVNLRAETNDTMPTPSRLVVPSTSKRAIQQELSQAIAASGNQLGDTALSVDSASSAISRVEDLNECSNPELNDCSKNARCINEFGSYRCQCLPGYEDRNVDDKYRAGRQCSSCSPSFCSNRGECLIIDGDKNCKCRGNFVGTQCEIDAEVLGVAVGGSIAALIIIVITFICLYMWNQRFKAEQAKIEAMSAASGHTFSYMNKHMGHTLSRMSVDLDRGYGGRGWNFSDSQTHLLRTSPTHRDSSPYGITTSDVSHMQHPQSSVYATPVRVTNRREEYEAEIPYPDYAGAPAQPRSATGFRSLKSKSHSRNSHTSHYPNFTMKHSPESYKETEFYSSGQFYQANGNGNSGAASNLYSSSHGYY